MDVPKGSWTGAWKREYSFSWLGIATPSRLIVDAGMARNDRILWALFEQSIKCGSSSWLGIATPSRLIVDAGMARNDRILWALF